MIVKSMIFVLVLCFQFLCCCVLILCIGKFVSNFTGKKTNAEKYLEIAEVNEYKSDKSRNAKEYNISDVISTN